ncbi:MAG TPA: hypothetical protein VNA25_07710 [Phycisphaerae bacterium]|nr:hypothetical protein [Phycisphaerae bacterium]HUT57723.1 hypothetical protein [Phycisphaerae bacterium]
MNPQKAAENLEVIRKLMERPIRFSTMSGLSAILAGAAALAGVLLDAHFWRRYDARTAICVNVAVWAGVLAAALAGVLVLTRLRERRQGMPPWSALKMRILLTMLGPFVAGAGLTIVIVGRWYLTGATDAWDQGLLIPAIWMLFYGVCLWQLGAFSPPEVRGLGAAFVLAGLAAAVFCPYWPHVSLGVTFGGFHILYGVIVYAKYGG